MCVFALAERRLSLPSVSEASQLNVTGLTGDGGLKHNPATDGFLFETQTPHHS